MYSVSLPRAGNSADTWNRWAAGDGTDTSYLTGAQVCAASGTAMKRESSWRTSDSNVYVKTGDYPAQNEAAQTVSPGRSERVALKRALQGVTRSLASATIARNSLLGLKTGTGRAATSTGSPVRGLRAMRVLRWRILNVPNPRTSMLCCSASAALTASRKESTTRAQSFLEMRGPAVRAICAVTFSTRSAFVIHPP